MSKWEITVFEVFHVYFIRTLLHLLPVHKTVISPLTLVQLKTTGPGLAEKGKMAVFERQHCWGFLDKSGFF